MMLTRMQDNANDDDGQSMIVSGRLVDKPNMPKIAVAAKIAYCEQASSLMLEPFDNHSFETIITALYRQATS